MVHIKKKALEKVIQHGPFYTQVTPLGSWPWLWTLA